jgi:hypothetical protein
VNFDRLAETEWTLREQIRDIASELTGEATEAIHA